MEPLRSLLQPIPEFIAPQYLETGVRATLDLCGYQRGRLAIRNLSTSIAGMAAVINQVLVTVPANRLWKLVGDTIFVGGGAAGLDLQTVITIGGVERTINLGENIQLGGGSTVELTGPILLIPGSTIIARSTGAVAAGNAMIWAQTFYDFDVSSLEYVLP